MAKIGKKMILCFRWVWKDVGRMGGVMMERRWYIDGFFLDERMRKD
jgi:hypothetical protein